MTEKFEKKYDCGILNFWSSNNYGALLTCYALQESVKELGLVPGIINYHCRWEKFEGLLSDRFSRKYLDLTEPCADFEDLRRPGTGKCDVYCRFGPDMAVQIFLAAGKKHLSA